MYKKLKKQNGEKFAQTIRNHHNGLLEIPDLDVILHYAGNDAEPLLPYLIGLLAPEETAPLPVSCDPFVLLDRAGYDAFYADTLEKQNSIMGYFAPGELLCTFNDYARHEKYHIVNAVKKDVHQIRRKNFKDKEQREDAYGTSVISIQMWKGGGFISIKNRYNHAVSSCDHTFDSNPDNIIEGLSSALKHHFNVEFKTTKVALPKEFVLIGNQIFKYHAEGNNIYFGDQAWAKNGTIHEVNRSAGDALFDRLIFDNKSKTLKKMEPESEDSFADDFNSCYGGNRALTVRSGNLVLDDTILIGAEQSRIKTLYLPALTVMSDNCLISTKTLTHFVAPALRTMGSSCFSSARALTHFEAPGLETMSNYCFNFVDALTHFKAPELTSMGRNCFCNASALTHFETLALTAMSSGCLFNANDLKHFEAPALASMGSSCLLNSRILRRFEAPALATIGDGCLGNAKILTRAKSLYLPRWAKTALETLGI